MIPLYWLSFNGPGRLAWDQDIIDVIAPSSMYRTATLEETEGGVVVIPARFNLEHVEAINEWLSHLLWCVVILTSDEESAFPFDQLHHPRMCLWIQSPRPDIHDHPNLRFLPVGWGEDKHRVWRDLLPSHEQHLSWFFSGQATHQRRDDMFNAMFTLGEGKGFATDGFTQGMERDAYLTLMASCKVAPSPSGPASADCFRTYEALEAGAVPIVDQGPKADEQGRATENYPPGFWSMLFNGPPPFPVVDEWSEAPGITTSILEAYPQKNNVVFAWWQLYKRELRNRLLDDVAKLGGNPIGPVGSNITVLIPTSPTPNNPDFSHLDLTITAIRDRLPNSEILLMIDGVHDKQSHLHDAYNEYIRRVLWKCNHQWSNTVPVLSEEYLHQSGKLIRTLPLVNTDFILWNEHDTPLEGDIDWDACVTELASDRLDLIRFYHEAFIHPEHEHLMRGRHNDLLMKTVQQSGRPHLARTDYYRRIMQEHFSPDSCTFVEFVMHSVCQCEDIQPWDRHRMALYAPQDGNPIKRSGHTDARGSEPTYDDTLRV